MGLVDTVRVLVDASVGNRGALSNCRRELRRTREAERAVDELCARLGPTPGSTETPLRTSTRRR